MTLLFPVVASAYTPKKEALLVGVSHYKNGGYGIDLPGVEIDIATMKKLLESRGFHVRILKNETATLNGVRRAMSQYTALNRDDVFFYYQSSHGTQIVDVDGTEEDGLDEAYVLYEADFASDGIVDSKGLLIDDELDRMLSRIHAKKMLMTDACHSGTMYKSLNLKARTKSIKRSKNYRGKAIPIPEVKPTNLVAFGASMDSEKSVDTDTGGLFTQAVYDVWSANPQISFRGMQRETTQHIENMCNRIQQSDSTVQAFHPVLYTTNQGYLNQALNRYLKVHIRVNPRHNLVEEYLDGVMHHRSVGRLNLHSKNYYRVGENIIFGIDTMGRRGHLYILTIKESENEISLLYPNPYYKNPAEQWQGRFSFPNAKTPFKFKASNESRGVERTVVYAILSDNIIPDLEVSRMGYNQFQSIFKDFNGQSSLKNAFKDILIRKKGNHIAIAKQVFSVGR